MRNVYLSQISSAPHVPYAVGVIWAYANQHQEIQNNYTLKEILFLRDPIDEVINRMEDPVVLGLSNYVWNQEYNDSFARQVKKKWKDCFIVYGGPNVYDGNELSKRCDFIDLVVRNEGEVTFYNVMMELLNDTPNWGGIGGITIPSSQPGNNIITPDIARINNLDIIPSPYSLGYFDDCDKLVKARHGADSGMDGTMQTNRGCMYSCTFCNIGMNYYNKVKLRSIDHVYTDLEWMADHNCQYIDNADSNFAIFPSDKLIAHKLVALKETTGYPLKLRTDWAKNAKSKVAEVGMILTAAGINHGMTLALQSVSEDTLVAINRKNIDSDVYRELNLKYLNAGLPTYTEIICPLPAETKSSFMEGICDLIEHGQHNCINIYDCSVTKGSEMNDEQYIKKYDLKFKRMITMSSHVKPAGTHDINNPSEYANIVVSTNTMSFDDWVRCRIMGYAVIAGHFYGLTHIISRFLRKYSNISYLMFYTKFTQWHLHNTTNNRFGRELATLTERLLQADKNVIVLNAEVNTSQGELIDIFWKYEESTFINGYLDKPNFFALLKRFVCEELSNEIDSELLDEVLHFTELYIVDHTIAYPISTEFKYNLADYIFNDDSLKKIPSSVTFDSKNYNGDLREYCVERAWYARQQGGARACIEDVKHIVRDPAH